MCDFVGLQMYLALLQCYEWVLNAVIALVIS